MVLEFVPAAPRAVPGRGVLVCVAGFNPNRSNTPTFPTPRPGLSAGSFNIL